MSRALARHISRHSRWLVWLILASLWIPVSQLKQARVDNAIEVWLGTGSKAHQDYQIFLDKYGTEEFIVVAGQCDDPLGDANLAAQKALAEKITAIAGVDQVLDLASVMTSLSLVRSDAKAFLWESPFFRDLILGRDNHTFGMLISLKTVDNPAERRVTVDAIDAAVQAAQTQAQKYHLAGTPVMNAALDQGSQRASQTIIPLALALSTLILWIVLRQLSGVVAVLCAVGVTTLWTVGAMVLTGTTFNMVTVVLPSLLFVLSLASGIHVTSRFFTEQARGQDRDSAMQATLSDVLGPVAMSCVSTAVGFGTLVISDMQPVKEFGLFAALGMLLSMVANLVVVPGVLLWLPCTCPSQGKTLDTHWTRHWAVVAMQHRGLVLGISGVSAVVCLALACQARVESNVLKFFPESSRIARDYAFVGDHLTGLFSVEVDASAPTPQSKALLMAMEACAVAIEPHTHVAKVIHYNTVATTLKQVSRSVLMDLPRARQRPMQQMQKHFLHREDQTMSLRMSVLVRAMSSRDLDRLVQDIDQQAQATLGTVGTYRITGVVPLLVAAQQSLARTQMQTLGLAMLVVLGLIGLFMRSWRALAAAILPNLLPIGGLFAVMVVCDIALDSATVMIASVAIGIAADDTIHFLSHYRRQVKNAVTPEHAAEACLSHIGRAITFTTMVSITGFCLMLLAQFKPIQYFGALASVTMVLAWIGDVCLLPVCVVALEKKNLEPRT
jgi:predicted RND superfamily exporter protein